MNIQSTQALAAQSMRFVSRTDGAEAVVPRVDMSKSSSESSINMTADDAKLILEKANGFFSKNGNLLKFELDQDAGKMVFYLKDAQTGETLRQIPDETV